MATRKPWQRTGLDTRTRGRAGQAMRQRRLARTNGLCEHCEVEGLVTLATAVDHIIPLAKGGKDIDSNTRNLCQRHHEAAGVVQFGRGSAAAGIGRDGRPTSAEHPWNRPDRT